MRGYLVKRYKRFLVDIETTEGEIITAYCPATGRMTTCLKEGAPVEYLRIENEDRKLDYDWWSIKMPESWVIIDTRPANQWLYWQRTGPWFPDDWKDAKWHSEPSLPEGGRLDFRLSLENGPTTWIEIKSVTWCEDGTGYFPDAPSDRAVRHLSELIKLQEQGNETYVIFVSMRSDIEEIRPAESIDPDFTSSFLRAREAGVKMIGLGSRVDDRLLQIRERIPVNHG